MAGATNFSMTNSSASFERQQVRDMGLKGFINVAYNLFLWNWDNVRQLP
jgi:hypothetical protein